MSRTEELNQELGSVFVCVGVEEVGRFEGAVRTIKLTAIQMDVGPWLSFSISPPHAQF